MNRFTQLVACAMAMAAAQCLVATPASAQEYPTRLIKLVVGNSPGSSQDLMARALGVEMAKTLGQPIVVESKVGAQQMIAYEYLAKQVPNDGYTIGILSPTIMAVAPLLFKDLRFDPLKDLPPFIGLGGIRLFLVSPAQAPWKNFAEFVEYAKANPGKLNYGAASPPPRLAMESILRAKGLNLALIPYKATAPMIQAMLANDVQIAITGIGDVLAQGDKFRVLATTGDQPYPQLPNVPLFSSLGPQVRGATYTLNAPVGTPQPALDKLYGAAAHALQTAPVQAQLATMKIEITGERPEVAAKGLAEEARAYADVARQIGFKPE